MTELFQSFESCLSCLLSRQRSEAWHTLYRNNQYVNEADEYILNIRCWLDGTPSALTLCNCRIRKTCPLILVYWGFQGLRSEIEKEKESRSQAWNLTPLAIIMSWTIVKRFSLRHRLQLFLNSDYQPTV
jgi:hypothetical protein